MSLKRFLFRWRIFFWSTLSCLFILLLLACVSSFPKVENAFAYSKVLYAKDKQILASLIAEDGQWRYELVSKNIPEKLKQSILAFEDKRFYSHFGIDLLAFARAAKLNFEHGRIVSGGSTITMQLARLLYKNRPRTSLQKTIELLYSLSLEARFSKNQILNKYISFAPYGGNIVGAQTASWVYFSRPLGAITWAESALLAVLPNNPANIHINRNRENLLIKRNKLLKKLKNLGAIDNTEYELSLSEGIPLAIKRPQNIASSLLTSSIKKYPKQNNFFSTLSSVRQKQLLKTTSYSLQELANHRIYNLAVVVIDNKLNEVVAYDGNAQAENINQKAQYLDLAMRARSTGSILKPFLYGELLDQGLISPSSIISDIPTYYKNFKPKNFIDQYSGVVPAKSALAMSLNIPAIRMLKRIGTSHFYDVLQELGLKNINRGADNYGLSLILGGAEENLWRITNSYSQMANVVTSMDQNIQRAHWLEGARKERAKFPLSIGASYLTLKALLEVNRPGSSAHWKTFSSSQKISWKTGTSQGFKDSWAVGVSGRYTVGVWAGNANGVGSADLIGVRIAAPIMFRVFNFLPRSNWFSKPTYELKEVLVCSKSGFRAHSACPARAEEIPLNSNFQVLDTFYQTFHLDETQKYQVNSKCYQVHKMKKWIQFVLPPIESYYYRRSNISYVDSPEWMPGCGQDDGEYKKLSILYPSKSLDIYLPHGLDGQKNKIVLKAAHSLPRSKLFWHLNNEFLGETTFEHQQEVLLDPGRYQLMVTDEAGTVRKRFFSVLKNY